MSFSVVIPARHASTRLPGKPLRLLVGKPMIEHVYQRAVESEASEVWIATDDQRIYDAAKSFSANVIMTSGEHHSGTDRLAEVVENRAYGADQVIVNLQGDEPLMPAALINQVAHSLAQHEQASVSTLCQKIETSADLFDPHVVKVVMDQDGYGLYFSRAVIPWDRDAFAVTMETLPPNVDHYRHIGLYAYRAGFIQDYVQWPISPLERMESLEQLRVLWQGHRIHVSLACVAPGHGVDTEQDLQRVEQQLQLQQQIDSSVS